MTKKDSTLAHLTIKDLQENICLSQICIDSLRNRIDEKLKNIERYRIEIKIRRNLRKEKQGK